MLLLFKEPTPISVGTVKQLDLLLPGRRELGGLGFREVKGDKVFWMQSLLYILSSTVCAVCTVVQYYHNWVCFVIIANELGDLWIKEFHLGSWFWGSGAWCLGLLSFWPDYLLDHKVEEEWTGKQACAKRRHACKKDQREGGWALHTRAHLVHVRTNPVSTEGHQSIFEHLIPLASLPSHQASQCHSPIVSSVSLDKGPHFQHVNFC